jgi:hypothetical protein
MKKMQIFVSKLHKLILANQFISYLAIFFIIYFVCLWLQATPTFLDPDSFYHLKMAKLIAARGPILDFPWLQFTVLKDYYVDHHFLYHVLAIPFIKILGDFEGMKFYSACLATIFIFCCYLFLKRYRLKYAGFFTLLLLTAPVFLFRANLTKATAFSLILLFAGVYCLFKHKYWLLFVLAFVYVWSYGGFILLLIMAALYSLAEASYDTFRQTFTQKKIRRYIGRFCRQLFKSSNLKNLVAVFLGLLLGIILNPYFPQNLKFYWQQLVQIGIINYRNVVNVGGEWYPYQISELVAHGGAIIVIGALAIIVFLIFIKKQQPISLFFLITTLLFLALSLKSKRYAEYFVPHLFFFSAFTFNYCLSAVNHQTIINALRQDFFRLYQVAQIWLIILIGLIPALMIGGLNNTKNEYAKGFAFTAFSGIADYLQRNSQSGDIVLHTDWGDFPMLFYYNDKNYYIVGLDPTFMYKYNPDLYTLYADITMAKRSTNLYQDIKETFRAKYVIVNKGRSQLARNLQNDGNFIKVYEDKDGAVYKLK